MLNTIISIITKTNIRHKKIITDNIFKNVIYNLLIDTIFKF